MNVGKSVRVAMAKRDMKPKALCELMGSSRQYVGQLMSNEQAGAGTINKLAEIFEMKVSEFIGLGED